MRKHCCFMRVRISPASSSRGMLIDDAVRLCTLDSRDRDSNETSLAYFTRLRQCKHKPIVVYEHNKDYSRHELADQIMRYDILEQCTLIIRTTHKAGDYR